MQGAYVNFIYMNQGAKGNRGSSTEQKKERMGRWVKIHAHGLRTPKEIKEANKLRKHSGGILETQE